MNKTLTAPKGLITIRIALPEDAAPLRELRLEALVCHPEAFVADPDSSAAESLEKWVDRIEKNISDQQGVICIASANDQLIGMAGLVRGHWPKTRHSGVIWGVYVKAEWRGLHLAERLIDECHAWAQAQGLKILKLGVTATNSAAIRCYSRCGFTVYGIEPKVIFANEVFYDELLMAKEIA